MLIIQLVIDAVNEMGIDEGNKDLRFQNQNRVIYYDNNEKEGVDYYSQDSDEESTIELDNNNDSDDDEDDENDPEMNKMFFKENIHKHNNDLFEFSTQSKTAKDKEQEDNPAEIVCLPSHDDINSDNDGKDSENNNTQDQVKEQTTESRVGLRDEPNKPYKKKRYTLLGLLQGFSSPFNDMNFWWPGDHITNLSMTWSSLWAGMHL